MAKITRRQGRPKEDVVRRPMAPVQEAQNFGRNEELGFENPMPKGVRPYVNPRVAVGDERLTAEERERFSALNAGGGPVPPPSRGRRVRQPEPEPDEEELDELGEGEYDPQTELEGEQFTDTPPAVAPLMTPTPRARTRGERVIDGRAPALTLRNVAIEDTDNLWDWVRSEADRGAAFFAKPITNSMELHEMMKGLLEQERQGTGAVRSIFWGEEHLGMLMLVPILSTERVAIMHVFLSPGARKSIISLLTPLVSLAIQLVPGFHVGLMALSKAQHDLYAAQLGPHGFKAHTLFIR